MEYRYSLSLFFVTIIGAVVLNFATYHIAEASPEQLPSPVAQIQSEIFKPTVFARFKRNAPSTRESLESSLHICAQNRTDHPGRNLSSDTSESCSPSPTLTSSKSPSEITPPQWTLNSSVEQIVFQKKLSKDQRISVELVGSNMLPWPTTVETSKLGLEHTVQIYPTVEIPEDSQMFLTANVYGKNGERIENWLVKLTYIKSNEPAL